MSTYETPPQTAPDTGAPPAPVGEHGEPCRECDAPLAGDQRYCLNCGRRRGEPRVPLEAVFGTRARAGRIRRPGRRAHARHPRARAGEETPRGAGQGREGAAAMAGARRGPLALVAAAAVGVAFGLGALLGVLAADDEPPVVRAAAAVPPDVNVTVQGGGAGRVGTFSPVSFTSDWPEGEGGWTVQLSCLPKEGNGQEQVDAAKAQAEEDGAAKVGALDTDDHDGLDAGRYCVYSGGYKSRKAASRALRKLKKGFPGAEVVRVTTAGEKARVTSRDELKKKQKLSPQEFQKQSKKLDKTQTEGKPPPKDDKKPGGGSESETFE